MNAPHEEAVEFAKQSKRENRVYVGNLSYDVKYRDLMEFMRGGGWGNNFRLDFYAIFSLGEVHAELACWGSEVAAEKEVVLLMRPWLVFIRRLRSIFGLLMEWQAERMVY